MSEEQDQVVKYSGIVWNNGEIYIQFDLPASDIDEAQAMAKARFGDERLITVHEKRPPAVTEKMKRAARAIPDEPGPLREYLGKLWVDGEPVVRFSVMAHGLNEASAIAEARYGDQPMSIWNEEDAHRLR